MQPIIFSIIVVAERFIETIRARGGSGEIEAEWTTWCLILSYLMVVSAASLECLLQDAWFEVTPLRFMGFVLFVFAGVCRFWVVRSLGSNNSIHIRVRYNHQLVVEGPFHYTRHPYYVSVVCELVGFCLLYNAYYSLYLILFVEIPLLALRIRLEEKKLLEKFGNGYRTYRSSVGILPPSFVSYRKQRRSERHSRLKR